MVYNKEEDILGMYKYECEKCGCKFMAQSHIKLHYRMSHNLIVNGNPSVLKKDTAMQRVLEYVHRKVV